MQAYSPEFRRDVLAACRTKKRIPTWRAEVERIRQAIEEKPGRTLLELKARLQTELSIQTLCRALKTLKLAYKTSSDRLGAAPAGRRAEAGRLAVESVEMRSGASRVH